MIAISSTEERLARLKTIGVDQTVNYNQFPNWEKRVRDLTGGRGVDHVVDVVGGSLAQVLQALR